MARQQAAETYIRQVVDARVQEILARQGNTALQVAPVQQPPGGSGAGAVVAAIITRAPEICTAIVSALNAFTQAKVMANPLGHLEIIAQAHPRLLALYSPNPLSDQFTNIFATAFAQGMRVASQGRAGTLGPLVPGAPAAPAAPVPLAPPSGPTGGPSASPSPALGPTGSPGSTPPSGGGSSTIMGRGESDGGFTRFSEEQFAALLSTVQEEYKRRYAGVH